MVGPINFDTLANDLYPEDRDAALAAPASNGTAPARIVAALLKRGHRVTVVTHSLGSNALSLNGANIRLIRVAARSKVRYQIFDRWAVERKAMRDALIETAPDVVHSNWAYEGALAAVSSGLPHVATIRDAPFTVLRYHRDVSRPVRLTMALEFAARSRRSVLTAVSPYLARAWQKQTLTSRDVDVIPNTITTSSAFSANDNRETDVIIEVADASKRKNVHALVEAFQIVRRTRPEAQLRLVGAGLGPDEEFARCVKSADRHQGVLFLGKRTSAEVASEMARATIHAHVALEETFGNTLVEAMAAGLPVLGGRQAAGVPWVLATGAAGVLVDVQRPQAIATALLDMLSNNAVRLSLARAGWERANSAFAPESVARAYESVYDRARGLR